jgi:hypothetical protein
MITSFKDIAAAMLHCVSVIEDYTRLTPTTLSNGKQPKKPKVKKDPLAPKKPPSSFLLFSNEIRQEIKEQNPEMGGKEILGIISEKWKTLTPEEKQVRFVSKDIVTGLMVLGYGRCLRQLGRRSIRNLRMRQRLTNRLIWLELAVQPL